jgi:hypothetical protein
MGGNFGSSWLEQIALQKKSKKTAKNFFIAGNITLDSVLDMAATGSATVFQNADLQNFTQTYSLEPRLPAVFAVGIAEGRFKNARFAVGADYLYKNDGEDEQP